MKRSIYVWATVTCFFMASCGNSEKQNQENKDSDSTARDTALVINKNTEKEIDTADLSFFKKAAAGGMTEVEAGSRMLVVSKDSTIKAFAKMMINDHTKANNQLKALAAKKGIQLPGVLPDKNIELIKNIDNYKNDGRNEYYAHMMVEDHKNTIDLFNNAINSKDPDISAFAKMTLPTLEHHYKMAKDMEAKVTAFKKNQGDDPLKLSDKKEMKH